MDHAYVNAQVVIHADVPSGVPGSLSPFLWFPHSRLFSRVWFARAERQPSYRVTVEGSIGSEVGYVSPPHQQIAGSLVCPHGGPALPIRVTVSALSALWLCVAMGMEADHVDIGGRLS